MIDAMIEVSKILTPEQIADFPPALRSSFDHRVLASESADERILSQTTKLQLLNY